MENKESHTHPDVFLVSGAGSSDVNGIYRSNNRSMNHGALNYCMTNSNAMIFQLCLSPSLDHGVRNWIIQKKTGTKDVFYKASPNGKSPSECDWTLDGVGQEPSPSVLSVSKDVEHELKTRLVNLELLSTLDLCEQYEAYCKASALKKLYMALWRELPKKTQEAAKEASKTKREPAKKKTITQKITIAVQLGLVPRPGRTTQGFNMMVTFNSLVLHLKESIANQVTKETGKEMELIFNGHKILSKLANINKLGIEKGSTIVVLGVKSQVQGKGLQIMGGNNIRPKRTSQLPALQECESNNFQEEDEKDRSLQVPKVSDEQRKSCAIS